MTRGCRTEFQKRLKSYVWGFQAAEGHWFMREDSPKIVRIPLLGTLCTTKRAIYAAFKGEIPGGVELRSNCGANSCVCPQHQEFKPARGPSGAGALKLPDLGYSSGATKHIEQRSGRLPSGLTLPKIQRVKEMSAMGAGVSAISSVVGLTISEVMKIEAGLYDRAVACVERGIASTKRRAAERRESLPSTPAESTGDATEEESEWLRSLK